MFAFYSAGGAVKAVTGRVCVSPASAVARSLEETATRDLGFTLGVS